MISIDGLGGHSVKRRLDVLVDISQNQRDQMEFRLKAYIVVLGMTRLRIISAELV